MQTSNTESIGDKIKRGLELAEHQMLRDKAIRNEDVVQGDGKGGFRVVSARKLLKDIYNEDYKVLVGA